MATSQDFVNWVCSAAIDHRFLKYVLLAEREAFLRFASGTTHQTIYFPEVKAFHICLPPIDEQRAIAHILGTLDDKIELTRRMNETLEAMARALFQSWFVDFDPVRAKAEGRDPGLPEEIAELFPDAFEESELGQIPKGWRVARLGEILELKRGYDLPTSQRQPGRVPVVSSSGVSGSHNEAKVLGPGIVTGRYGTIGKVFYVREDFWPLNTTLYVCDFRGNDLVYAYYLLRLIDFEKFSDKAAVPGVNRNALHEELIVAPPQSTQRCFSSFAARWRERLSQNNAQAATLAALRDTLLPKLISGELRVQDAQRFVRGVGSMDEVNSGGA